MGGPIDPQQVSRPRSTTSPRPSRYSWFETNVMFDVPPNYPGKGRRVYPGFMQHAGFVAMNPSRHFTAHWDFYQNLLRGDLDDAAAHRRFYDEYNAVLDLPAEFYLDTIRVVFQQHLLPRGEWLVDGTRVAPEHITRHRPADHRGRTRRHFRPRPDARCARPVQRHRGRTARTHRGRGRRPLRHLQRPPLARHRVSGRARVHTAVRWRERGLRAEVRGGMLACHPPVDLP